MAEQKEDKSMKAGRVSQTVYRRSVLKQIQNNIERMRLRQPSLYARFFKTVTGGNLLYSR